MRKFTKDLVLLMHALQWLKQTSRIFNYAAPGTACQYQRCYTLLYFRNTPAVLVTFDPQTLLSLYPYSSKANLLNKDLIL